MTQALSAGTLAGLGSFRCEGCGYVLALDTEGALPPCPACGGARFTRASLFADRLMSRRPAPEPTDAEHKRGLLESVADDLAEPGRYLVYAEGDAAKVVPLAREWTRIGRSLAADVRFDDSTVSRRHALIVRQADGVRVLDDRSLNGVFVNGERVEWRVLHDGDEIVVGRYRLHYVEIAAPGTSPALGTAAPGETRA
jgi:predicted  nucleic acid-binding Zn-ribbon protein